LKEQWRQLAARFDARPVRERVLLFLGVIVCTILLYQTLALDPIILRQKRVTGQLTETRQNIKTTDIQVRKLETIADPDAVRRSYRDALRKQLAEIDQNMQGLQKGLVPPERMAKLLEQMLDRNRGVQLVSLRTLPAQRFENPAAPAARPPEKGAKPAIKEPERNIYQHSFEITLQGSYADLHDYLARLERLPSQMFWGRIRLDTEHYPKLKVTLTVHTLSLNKAWLIV
jgi:MSHA biogenesis protein MshJ